MYKESKEPFYIRLYINNLCYNKLPKSLINPVLVEVLYRTNPASDDEGQYIVLSEDVKKEIAQRCSVSLRQVREHLNELTENDVLQYKGNCTYRLNPFFFGKGTWGNIHNSVNRKKW